MDVYQPHEEMWRESPKLPMPFSPFGAATVNGHIYVFGGVGAGAQFFPDVLTFDTGFRAVEANGKLRTRWGELKAVQQQR